MKKGWRDTQKVIQMEELDIKKASFILLARAQENSCGK